MERDVDAHRDPGCRRQGRSIEKGKKANFVLADGDIFEYGTHVTQTVVNGKLAGVDSRYTSLYERFKKCR